MRRAAFRPSVLPERGQPARLLFPPSPRTGGASSPSEPFSRSRQRAHRISSLVSRLSSLVTAACGRCGSLGELAPPIERAGRGRNGRSRRPHRELVTLERKKYEVRRKKCGGRPHGWKPHLRKWRGSFDPGPGVGRALRASRTDAGSGSLGELAPHRGATTSKRAGRPRSDKRARTEAAPQTRLSSLVTAAVGRCGAPAARAGERLARRARPTKYEFRQELILDSFSLDWIP